MAEAREEFWRDIPGHEGRYQASSLGRVRSVDRIVNLTNRFGKAERRFYKSRVLKPGLSSSGYATVMLGRDTGTVGVHVLVLSAFCGEPPPGAEARHMNADRLDNRIENLAWGSRSENSFDVADQDRRRLTKDQVRELRRRRASGERNKDLAEEFGLSETGASAVFYGRSYRRVR